MEMRLSKRVLQMPASPIRKLVPYADAAKKRGIKVYHLNIGQPDIHTPKEMMEAIKKTKIEVLAYGPSNGIREYREALPKYYAKHGIDITSENIIVTTAGSEAIIFTMMAVCDYGEEVIIPEPYYTNYNGFAKMAGVKVVPVTTKAENGFALPPMEEIETKIGNKTKAILFSNPGNPTGVVYTKEEIRGLVELAKKHKLFLIADEVYREFVYEGAIHNSVMDFEEISDRAVIVDSISKRYSACGARVGCIVSKNQMLMENIMKLAQARLCPPTLEQYAALAAINLPDSYFKEVLAEYQKRRDLVYDALKKIPEIICQKPKGAFYIIAKLPIQNAEKFAIFMLENFAIDNETVMFAPAAGFYGTEGVGEDEIRIAYILNTKDLERAMYIFREGLEEYKKIEE